MKKRLLVAIVLALILSLTVVASASAKQVKPLLCRADIAVPTPGHPDNWFGTVHGAVRGTIESGELPSYDFPDLYTFTEWFTITTKAGVIQGYDMGIWYLDTGKYRACGWVTHATGSWKHLVGYLVYEYGVTVDHKDTGVTTIDGAYMGFMPPLPSAWAKVWR